MSAATEYLGTGRRKCAVARVRMAPGEGKITINGRPLESYFVLETHRMWATAPLAVTNTATRFDTRVSVSGGGPTGQAGAVRLGIARALLKADPAFRPAMKTEGLLTRDARVRERKKYGQPGARKRYQFSKR